MNLIRGLVLYENVCDSRTGGKYPPISWRDDQVGFKHEMCSSILLIFLFFLIQVVNEA